MSDCQIPDLGNKTPMQSANLPVMDRLASEGLLGLADPIEPGTTATTVAGSLAILGYDPFVYSIGRGVIEALGSGTKMDKGDVAMRGNWATIDADGRIIDRRAGRIREGTKELAASLSNMNLGDNTFVDVGASTEHRLAVIIKGTNLKACIAGSDPGDTSPVGSKPKKAISLNLADPDCQKTADYINQFEERARLILQNHPVNLDRISKGLQPANAVLTRESGEVYKFPKITDPAKKPLAGICIAGEDTIVGISRIVGIETCQTPAMTSNLDTNLREKFRLTAEHLRSKDFVFLHIKGCDIASHNKDPHAKRNFLEKIDLELGEFLEAWQGKLRLVITADHSTSSINGAHFDDPVPVLLHGHEVERDSVQGFDEILTKEGDLGRFRMCELWDLFFKNELS